MPDILQRIIVSRLAQLVERVTSIALRNDEVSRSSRLMGIVFIYPPMCYLFSGTFIIYCLVTYAACPPASQLVIGGLLVLELPGVCRRLLSSKVTCQTARPQLPFSMSFRIARGSKMNITLLRRTASGTYTALTLYSTPRFPRPVVLRHYTTRKEHPLSSSLLTHALDQKQR